MILAKSAVIAHWSSIVRGETPACSRVQCMPAPFSHASIATLLALSTQPLPTGNPAGVVTFSGPCVDSRWQRKRNRESRQTADIATGA